MKRLRKKKQKSLLAQPIYAILIDVPNPTSDDKISRVHSIYYNKEIASDALKDVRASNWEDNRTHILGRMEIYACPEEN